MSVSLCLLNHDTCHSVQVTPRSWSLHQYLPPSTANYSQLPINRSGVLSNVQELPADGVITFCCFVVLALWQPSHTPDVTTTPAWLRYTRILPEYDHILQLTYSYAQRLTMVAANVPSHAWLVESCPRGEVFSRRIPLHRGIPTISRLPRKEICAIV